MNSLSSRAQIWNGSIIGVHTAVTSFEPWYEKEENMRLVTTQKEELSHYSSATTDIEYMFPLAGANFWGHCRQRQLDLHSIQITAVKPIEYFDPETNENIFPHVIEPSLGADRVALALLVEAYDEEKR